MKKVSQKFYELCIAIILMQYEISCSKEYFMEVYKIYRKYRQQNMRLRQILKHFPVWVIQYKSEYHIPTKEPSVN